MKIPELTAAQKRQIADTLIDYYRTRPDQDDPILMVLDGGPPVTPRSIVEGLRKHDERTEHIIFRLFAVGMMEEPLAEILKAYAPQTAHQGNGLA